MHPLLVHVLGFRDSAWVPLTIGVLVVLSVVGCFLVFLNHRKITQVDKTNRSQPDG